MVPCGVSGGTQSPAPCSTAKPAETHVGILEEGGHSGLIITWSPWRSSHADKLQKRLIKDPRNPPNFHSPPLCIPQVPGRAGCAFAGGSFFPRKAEDSSTPHPVSFPGSGLRAHAHIHHLLFVPISMSEQLFGGCPWRGAVQ